MVMPDIPVRPYLYGGRELCVTGACLLTASSDWLGRAIRIFEGDDAWCSHAAPVVRFPVDMVGAERVTLIEALEHGLTPTYLSHYFGDDFAGRLFLFMPDGLTPEIQARFRAWMLDKMFSQTGYDYGSLARQVAGHAQEDDELLFCSEAWGMAAEAAGLPRLPGVPQGSAPQPPDISRWWAGKVVELIGPFKAQEAA